MVVPVLRASGGFIPHSTKAMFLATLPKSKASHGSKSTSRVFPPDMILKIIKVKKELNHEVIPTRIYIITDFTTSIAEYLTEL